MIPEAQNSSRLFSAFVLSRQNFADWTISKVEKSDLQASPQALASNLLVCVSIRSSLLLISEVCSNIS